MSKIFRVFVELYDLLLTARKDDRSGRVVSTGPVTIADLIAIAVKRRTDLSPVTLEAAYLLLREIAVEELCNAKHVEFGLTHNSLLVDGIFIGDHPTWNKDKNSLRLGAVASVDVRKSIETIEVEVLGMASSGIFINTLTDVVSGETNSVITPGGGVKLTGSKMKVTGDSEDVGIHLTEINSQTVFGIPATSILDNDPSKITFIVPADLPAGDYKLSITTQFSNFATDLKEPRTYIFDYVLACNV
ncbi:MAG: DUF4469 domain-containing protein [Prevotellaceae bacterium]|jgi:hypothetical protein|nr:DUF4469 domain-containing protein [Prevotellaceae bacterium]